MMNRKMTSHGRLSRFPMPRSSMPLMPSTPPLSPPMPLSPTLSTRTSPTLPPLLTPRTLPRPLRLPLLTLLLLLLLTATAPNANAEPAEPAANTTHPLADTGETPSPASAPDRAAIEQILNNYTTAVTNSDEALFMTTLLDDQIPFFAAGDVATQPPTLKSADTHAFAAFNRAVFHSNTRLHQTFDHVTIEQDKSLACVRLHFITRVVSSGAAAEGWKTLQLLKVGDQWKIASEFYTVRSQRSNATPDRQDAKTH